MTSRTRVFLLIGLLFAAIGCYLYGSKNSVFVFIALGLFLELAFWIGLFSTERKTGSHT